MTVNADQTRVEWGVLESDGRALSEHVAYISRTVTASYPDGMDPELVMRRRVGKVFVESGELADAIEGYTGENPRKGVYATRDDVIKELIDCASAALCAVEFMTGDRGEALPMLARQVAGNATRLAAALVATKDPRTETRVEWGVPHSPHNNEPSFTCGSQQEAAQERDLRKRMYPNDRPASIVSRTVTTSSWEVVTDE